jgi:hypothetical protein
MVLQFGYFEVFLSGVAVGLLIALFLNNSIRRG